LINFSWLAVMYQILLLKEGETGQQFIRIRNKNLCEGKAN